MCQESTPLGIEQSRRGRILPGASKDQSSGEVSSRSTALTVSALLLVQECGVALEGFRDWQQGDTVECYSVQEVKRQL